MAEQRPRERSSAWGRRTLLQGALFLCVLLGFRAYQTRTHATGPAPRASAQLLSGEPVSLGGPGNEVVVLHFWATWCAVCRAEEDNVQALAARRRVITVASRSGSPAQVQRYLRSRGLSFPVVDDERGRLAKLYGVRAYPTTFFVDRNGTIARSEVGYTTTLGLVLRHWLTAL